MSSVKPAAPASPASSYAPPIEWTAEARSGGATQAPDPAPSPLARWWSAWRSLVLVGVVATGTVVAADRLAARAVPPVHRKEVQDAIADLRARDPEVLVLGSSHARTFLAVGDEIARRTAGRRALVAVPVEAGKLATYQWVLEHRLTPLLDERDAEGRRVRTRLRQFVLLTEWWDSCPVSGGIGGMGTNLPSRAWTWREFAVDVARHGVTDYNRNYLQTRWSRLWWNSALMQDRGQQRIPIAVRGALGLNDPGREPRRVEARLGEWRAMIEDGAGCIGSAQQMAALDAMLAWARARGLETTVVLFPRKPGTLTERGKATTLARFAGLAGAATAAHGARLVDYTWVTPLGDDDFMDDFDHVTLDGNRRFATWALDRELATLLRDAGSTVAAGDATGGAR